MNNASFGNGPVVNLGSGNVSNIRFTSKRGDFGALRTELANTGLDNNTIKDLEDVIDNESQDNHNKKFCAKVMEWMGKAFMKAVDGSWKIGQSAAARFCPKL